MGLAGRRHVGSEVAPERVIQRARQASGQDAGDIGLMEVQGSRAVASAVLGLTRAGLRASSLVFDWVKDLPDGPADGEHATSW